MSDQKHERGEVDLDEHVADTEQGWSAAQSILKDSPLFDQKLGRGWRLSKLALIALMVFVVGMLANSYFAYTSFELLAGRDITMERQAYEVVYYDEVLTMSARMAALTGEVSWTNRYDDFEPRLDHVIREILEHASPSQRAAFVKTQVANDGLVALERQALSNVRQGHLNPARGTLFGAEYLELKRVYSQGVNVLLDGIRAQSEQRRQSQSRAGLVAFGLAFMSLTTSIWLLLLQRQIALKEEMLRAELRVVSRRRAIDRLATSLTHELTQPLSATSLYLEAAQAHVSKPNPDLAILQEAIAGGTRQCQRASEIIQRIRDFARKSEPRRERVVIKDCLIDAIDLVAPEARSGQVEVKTDFAAEDLCSTGDRVQLEQVFVNLLLNAVEACAETKGRGRVIVSTTPAEGGIAVQVADNGPGLPETRSDAFKVLTSTKPHGLGVGLAIVQDIVESHGGSLLVRSSSAGATFRVWLPRC